jgi:hypothetical protein
MVLDEIFDHSATQDIVTLMARAALEHARVRSGG